MGRLKTCALDSLAETTLLSLPVETLHSVLYLVDRFLLPIKPLHTNQIVGISHKI